MSEEGKPVEDKSTEESAAPDLKNVQAEFYRKTDKLAQENQRLSEQLAGLTNILQAQSRPSPSAVEDDLEDLAFKDPKQYARRVQEQAMAKAEQMIDSRIQQQNQSQQLIMQLAGDYPELNDANSELTVRAVSIYKTLSQQEQRSPMAYKVAVRDAAAELGILVKNKRSKNDSDGFALSGNSNEGNRSRKGAKEVELDSRTIAVAELMGIKVGDKAVLERLKARAQRKSWGKYE